MVFNSATFLVFLLCFYFPYWWINNAGKTRLRNLLIVVASFVFYGWWDWRFLGLLVLSAGTDFWIGARIAKTENIQKRKFLLICSLAVNLGILGFFKYFNFFSGSLHELFNAFGWYFPETTMNIILPVGISFYTFQALSYTIDIYKKRLQPTSDWVQYFAFIAFFPQLVAGPIERATHLLPQFETTKRFSFQTSVEGLRLLLWGFFKKIVIADNFGAITDAVFKLDTPNGTTVLIGTVCFALQIYADFSGYSDIAIGVSRMLGFDLMANFRTPYFAKSFTDFWSRWHISLSTWFRDYVYIPLGGNREGAWKTQRNLFLTFLLSGLWHGASWNFVIWGAAHGLLLLLEKNTRLVKQGVYRYFTLVSVVALWLPFRAQTWSQLKKMLSSLFEFGSYRMFQIHEILRDFSFVRFQTLLVVVAVFFFVEWRIQLTDFSEWVSGRRKWLRISIYYGLVLAMLFIGNISVKPSFIYFQF